MIWAWQPTGWCEHLPNLHPLRWSAAKGHIAHPKGAYRTCQTSLYPVVDQEHASTHAHDSRAGTDAGSRAAKATGFLERRASFVCGLNVEPSARAQQPIAVGIDPWLQTRRDCGVPLSRRIPTLNMQAEARTGVKEAEKDSTRMRRTRRSARPPAASRARTANTAKRGCRPPPGPDGSGNCGWPAFSCQLFARERLRGGGYQSRDDEAGQATLERQPFRRWKWASTGFTRRCASWLLCRLMQGYQTQKPCVSS